MFLRDVGMVLWLSLPLVGANMLPVLVGNERWPMDFGWRWFDRRPLLGPGKTWTGFTGGIGLAVVLTASLSILVFDVFNQKSLYDIWQMDEFLFWRHMLWLALGALGGDAIKSFIKRRLSFERGQAWYLADQFDAVIGGFLLSFLCDRTWFTTNFIPGRWPAVLFLLFVYFVAHQALSRWAHRNGLKTSPC